MTWRGAILQGVPPARPLQTAVKRTCGMGGLACRGRIEAGVRDWAGNESPGFTLRSGKLLALFGDEKAAGSRHGAFESQETSHEAVERLRANNMTRIGEPAAE